MALIIAVIIGLLLAAFFPKATTLLAVYTVLASVFLISNWLARRKHRCPNCKKYYTMKEIDRTIKTIHPSTKRVDRTRYNPTTGRDEYYSEIVPATIYYYDVKKVCQICGHKIYDVDSKKE